MKNYPHPQKRIVLAIMIPSIMFLLAVVALFWSKTDSQEREASAETIELVGFHSPVLEYGRSEKCLTLPPGRLIFIDPRANEPITVDRNITVEYRRSENGPPRPTGSVECPNGLYPVLLSEWRQIRQEAGLQRRLAGQRDRISVDPEGGQK